ncbi:Membrane-associated zinc metalloprotease [Fulvivirga imtechensis AK7]|uniref:Zinc metalloprotease n=1 Tax=Fulvivirga imtechensis AK7 TaxID=1237149 RepID=L8JYN9_9BACT|nr:RIP metalloprotease RseP [Fulvivirga imtechensis]ELR72739.1 Membrane-associated zinc metalloprotease [Fulvivirga imtechensis AK7]
MEGLVMTAQIILSLSILVGLHEMGHLLAAKAFGMRVEQFSIGFPPKIFSFKYGETEYALSAIPLGGFVKISGMIDESMDVEAMKEPPKPYEFRSKPAWQRLIVMLGGIIVNVITGIAIFIFLTYAYGDTFISNDAVNEHGGIVAYELGQELGLQTGDKIVKVNGKKVEDFSEILDPHVFMGDGAYYTVERNGEMINIPIPGNFIEKMNNKEAAGKFISPRLPAIIGEISEGSLAKRIDLQRGDQIIEISGTAVAYHDEVYSIMKSYKQDSIHLKINRNGEVLTYHENFKSDSIIGYLPHVAINYDQVDYTLGESLGLGTERAFGIVFLQIKAFGKMFSGELSVTKSLAGPIGIAQAYGGDWQWERFWRMTGLLSMVLAFMNLLPIPALDGGHVMFLSYEIISGRKPSDKFLENAQKVGMVFLLLLMVFIIFNDIFKVVGIV